MRRLRRSAPGLRGVGVVGVMGASVAIMLGIAIGLASFPVWVSVVAVVVACVPLAYVVLRLRGE